jgi:hypothetical protein
MELMRWLVGMEGDEVEIKVDKATLERRVR